MWSDNGVGHPGVRVNRVEEWWECRKRSDSASRLSVFGGDPTPAYCVAALCMVLGATQQLRCSDITAP